MKELPVELWKEIFERAIEDSELLDPLYEHYPRRKWFRNPPGSYSRYTPPNIVNATARFYDATDSTLGDTNIRTKLAFASTSSQWRKIALPYLFRTVVFTTLRQLELLTALVRGSRYRYVDGPHNIRLLLEGKGTGYGAMIKRIDCRIHCQWQFITSVSSLID